jgi:undecaprenyl-diphosphatase
LTLWQALVMGVLQGVTEFLPISSSGHLVLAQNVWPGLEGSFFLFDVVVHLGTICAILWVLRRRVGALLSALAALLARGNPGDPIATRWLGLIVVASIPTTVLGIALRDLVEGMQTRIVWVGAALVVTALLLFVAERWGARTRGPTEMGWVDALIVGVAQGVAVLPGISRSGATVTAALCRDARADVAVEFSMLISIPAVIGANLLEGARAGLADLNAEKAQLIVGFLAAFVAGALSLRALQWVVQRRLLLPFAAYCAVVGLGVIGFG